MVWVIAAYEVDRVYGGPEEGGWWYDTGNLVRVLGVRATEDEAYAVCYRMNGWLDRLQRHVRDVGSVAYKGGRYAIEAHSNVPPPFYPATRPHYE